MAETNAVGDACAHAVSTVIEEYRPHLMAAALGHDHRAVRNDRHEGNFLSRFDLELHGRYKEIFTAALGDFIYLSEEGDPETVGAREPDLVVLVDPLDTTELAVRGLNGYTQALVFSRTAGTPVAAAVGDFFHEVDLYTAAIDATGTHATLRTRGGLTRPLSPARTPADGRLLITNYLMRPSERLMPLASQGGLINALTDGFDGRVADSGPTGDRSRLGVDFGSIGLCHVASGATDAFIEFAKGFATWDLLPGRFILEAAGGHVCDLAGHDQPWPTQELATGASLSKRQPFIAAGSQDLAKRIADVTVSAT